MTATVRRCPFPNCATDVDVRRWACKRHFAMLPTATAARVSAFYHPHREATKDLFDAEAEAMRHFQKLVDALR